MFRKKVNIQAFPNSEYRYCFLKNSVLCIQTLQIKRSCPTIKDFYHHSRKLSEKFLKQGFNQKLAGEQLNKVDKLVRDSLLQERDLRKQDSKCISLILTYRRFCTEIYSSCLEKLEHSPIQEKSTGIIPKIPSHIEEQQSKNIIAGTSLKKFKVQKFHSPCRTGKCTSFLLVARTLYCNQATTTNPYRSKQTKPTFNCFFNLNCKRECNIYLMECILCNIQYVGKA